MKPLSTMKQFPHGFLLYDIEKTKQLEQKVKKAKQILKKHNIYQIILPTLDFKETFSTFHPNHLFICQDHLGNELALRNDNTLQIIKSYSNQIEHDLEQKKEFKCFYLNSTFKDIKRNYPTLRETYQLGTEFIGNFSSLKKGNNHSLLFKVISIAHEILSTIYHKDYYLNVGTMEVYEYFKKNIFYKSQESFKTSIIKKDLMSLVKEFKLYNWQEDIAMQFASLLLFNHKDNLFLELNRLSQINTEFSKHILEVKKILANLKKLIDKLAKIYFNIQLEPFMLREASYYSGILFEGFVENSSLPPLRGGEYDELVSLYSNYNVPACGFALDISNIN